MGWRGGVSLRWKVPALIALAVVVAVGVFGVDAYLAVERSTLENTFARLSDVSRHVGALIDAGFERAVQQVRTVADHPAVVATVRDARTSRLTDAERSRAEQALSVIPLDTTGVVGVELVTLDGRVLASHGAPHPFDTRIAQAAARESVYISPLRQERDSIFWEMILPVTSPEGPSGLVRVVRHVRGPSPGVSAVLQLVGSQAELLLGNRDGSLWTNLARRVQRPPVRPEGSSYVRDGRPRMAVSTPLRLAPWYVGIEHPRATVLAPSRALIRRFAVLALFVVVGGVVVGDRLTRGITRSLSRLTTAAESIAAGEYATAPQSVERADEIGRLARAFVRMSDSVRDAHEDQARRIAERTAALEGALARLREAQEELVRKERLATLGQLSSSVGHELRNPLGVMANAVYYLQATLPEAPPKARQYLDLLETQIRLSERIVSDLLGFTRIRSPERAVVSVDAVINEQLARACVPETIRVVQSWPPTVPALHVDPVQVGQIVLNLLTNAVQAMEGDERCGDLVIGAESYGAFVRLEFRDAGPGIPAGDLEQIFEPLFTTKARGIGLGLAVSRSLAQVNGGRLWAENHVPRGARFILELPAATAAT